MVFKKIGADMSDPSKISLQQFLSSPMSAPLWKILTMFEINQNDPMLMKWWRKIKNDQKDPWQKLNKYIQAMSYILQASETFWMTMAINPTSWSAQKIITYMTVIGDWIRAANLDTYRWSDRYYRAAENIALAEKTGANIFKFIDELWPAGLKGQFVHYAGKPFDTVTLVPMEEIADCVIAPPLKNFRFNPDKVWPDDIDNAQVEPFEETPKRSKKRRQQSDSDCDEDSADELPKVL